MALAKYLEDLTESYLDGIAALSGGETRDPATEWRKREPTPSDVVVLRHPGGCLWDDSECFSVGEKILAAIHAQNPSLKVKVTWTPNHREYSTVKSEQGKLLLSASGVVSGRLAVQCGEFLKTYRVAFVQSKRLETLPAFALPLAEITRDPSHWTQPDFDRFREQISVAQVAHELPEEFCQGVREYLLGLHHEQTGEPRFGQRLDTAHRLLRPFVPYSPLARAICTYQSFRLNVFSVAHALQGLSVIRRTSAYFLGLEIEQPKGGSSGENLELITSGADSHIFTAVDAAIAEDWRSAADCIMQARASLAPHDYSGRERVAFLALKVAGARGDAKEAARFALELSTSSVPLFVAASTAVTHSTSHVS
jgi:hypothetical protein